MKAYDWLTAEYPNGITVHRFDWNNETPTWNAFAHVRHGGHEHLIAIPPHSTITTAINAARNAASEIGHTIPPVRYTQWERVEYVDRTSITRRGEEYATILHPGFSVAGTYRTFAHAFRRVQRYRRDRTHAAWRRDLSRVHGQHQAPTHTDRG